jgi:RimJ/RimL family protein N-acetyltransferase
LLAGKDCARAIQRSRSGAKARTFLTIRKAAMLQLVDYDRTYLDLSWDWLRDPETKALTMTPDFSRDDQRAFFASLPTRTDYKVWGVAVDGHGPVGAAGIKRISDDRGEYWGYLGKKDLWSRGLGRDLIAAVEAKARDAGLAALYLDVACDNERAIRLYRRVGYRDTGAANGVLRMEKTL